MSHPLPTPTHSTLPSPQGAGERPIKALWRLSFHDTEEFIDLYFRLRYRDDICLTLSEGGEIVSALQILPYPMTYGTGVTLPTGYISGACTHPDHRGEGLMKNLLGKAFRRMWNQGVVVSTLIPGEPWLWEYYRQTGYEEAFHYRVERFVCPEEREGEREESDGDIGLEEAVTCTEEICRLLDERLRQHPCCILHPSADLRVVMADLRLSSGHLFLLRHGGAATALCFAYPDGQGGWEVKETASVRDGEEALLLRKVCRRLMCRELTVRHPGHDIRTGMLRIINLPRLLSLYAAAHPEIETRYIVRDPHEKRNTGFYYLHEGTCRFIPSRRQAPTHPDCIGIGSLVQPLFREYGPYMSLMMD